MNPVKLAWKSHYSPVLLLRALQSFLPGWEYHAARLPERSGVCSWRCEGQPKQKRLGCVGQPSSGNILHPMPHPYRKPHTCSALRCSQQLPHKLGLCRPSQKPRQRPESVFQPLTVGHPTKWHKMGGFLAKKGSSKEKSSQQRHMAVAGQGGRPATTRAGLCCHMQGAVEAPVQTAKSRPGRACTARFKGKQHPGGKAL